LQFKETGDKEDGGQGRYTGQGRRGTRKTGQGKECIV